MYHSKLGKLKAENSNMQRQITRDKYHNRREEDAKDKKRELDDIKEEIEKLSEEVLKEQAQLEEEQERNIDPQLEKRQKEVTMNLK